VDHSATGVSPDTPLTGCPHRQTTFELPAPLSERLDRLVELADDEGARTSRKEVVAALVLAASESGRELADSVVRYRTAKARDAAVGADMAVVLQVRTHQPGPRRKAR
jgi:hypothetical protein